MEHRQEVFFRDFCLLGSCAKSETQPQGYLQERFGLTAAHIVEQAKSVIAKAAGENGDAGPLAEGDRLADGQVAAFLITRKTMSPLSAPIPA